MKKRQFINEEALKTWDTMTKGEQSQVKGGVILDELYFFRHKKFRRSYFGGRITDNCRISQADAHNHWDK